MTSAELVWGGVSGSRVGDPVLLAAALGAMCADHDEVDGDVESSGGDAPPRPKTGER